MSTRYPSLIRSLARNGAIDSCSLGIFQEDWLANVLTPDLAYIKKALRYSAPEFLAEEARISSGWQEQNTTISSFALLTATFKRLSPFSRLNGPKLRFMVFVFLSGPKQIEKSMTSRSSPWTFSRFLTNISSPPGVRLSLGLASNLASSMSVIRSCCFLLKVTTPMESLESFSSLTRRTISLTMALASSRLTPRPFS